MINYECGDKLVKLSSTYMAMMPQGLLDTAVGKKSRIRAIAASSSHPHSKMFHVTFFTISIPQYLEGNSRILLSVYSVSLL